MKTEKYLNEIQLANKAMREEYKTLMSEDYQVVLQLPQQPLEWRVTYGGKNSNKVKMIEEMKDDQVISCSIFRGKSCNGYCSEDVKYFKPMLMIKASYLVKNNPEIIIESYFRQH